MKTTKFAGILLMLGAGLMSFSAFAADGWEAALTVSAGRAENRLSFGQRPDATDGVDGKYDVPAMLAGDVRAYFELSGGSYWRDIRTVGSGKKEWKLKVSSSAPGDIKVGWKPEALPKGSKMTLRDAKNDKEVGMSAAGEYTLVNEGTRELRLEISAD